MTANTVLADLRKRLSVIQDAYVLTIPPPPVQGLGSAGGFKMMLQDRAGLGSDALARGGAGPRRPPPTRIPTFAGAFTLFSTRSPSVYADIDRVKAEKVGLTPTDVFSTLQVYLGSQYVNDFNYLGRTYQVIAQADGNFRRTAARHLAPQGPQRLRRDGADRHGGPAQDETAPYRVPRYNLFPAAEVQGVAAPGVATGTALHRMEELAHQVLPPRHRFRVDRARFPATAARHADPARVRRRRSVRLPRARRAIRKLEAAARDRADRADVPARLGHRPALRGACRSTSWRRSASSFSSAWPPRTPS